MFDAEINAAEIIPYKDFKDRCRKINAEIAKGRKIQWIDGVIYSSIRNMDKFERKQKEV